MPQIVIAQPGELGTAVRQQDDGNLLGAQPINIITHGVEIDAIVLKANVQRYDGTTELCETIFSTIHIQIPVG